MDNNSNDHNGNNINNNSNGIYSMAPLASITHSMVIVGFEWDVDDTPLWFLGVGQGYFYVTLRESNMACRSMDHL